MSIFLHQFQVRLFLQALVILKLDIDIDDAWVWGLYI